MIFLSPSSERLYLQRTLNRSSYQVHGLGVWGSHVAQLEQIIQAASDAGTKNHKLKSEL
jgi:hypothetical protein